MPNDTPIELWTGFDQRKLAAERARCDWKGNVIEPANDSTVAIKAGSNSDAEGSFSTNQASGSTITIGAATSSRDGVMTSSDKDKLDGIADDATKVSASSTNGNIKINDVDTSVYTHPAYGPSGVPVTVGESTDKTPAFGETFKVLMAPTLRKSTDSAHPFRDLYQNRAQFEQGLENVSVSWAFHPLETGLPAPGNVSEKLLECDLLVTDYSSIVYEAYLLDIPTLFYIPDIEAYRLSPGLNIDPLTHVPELCALDEQNLATLIASFANAEGMYPSRAIEYRSLLVTVRNPSIPVSMALATATPRTTSPGFPINASTAAPTAQSCLLMNSVHSGEAAAVTRLLHE